MFDRLPEAGRRFQAFRLARAALRVGRHPVDAVEQRNLGVGTGDRHAGFGKARRLGKLRPGREFPRRHLAIGVLRHLAHFVRRDIACDHQDGVVWRVMMIVEILGREAVDAAHFLGPADHGPAIGMGKMQRRLHLFVHQGLGLVVHPHAALFQHHIALRPDMGIGQIQIGQPVGLELHCKRQPVLGDLFVEGGVVVIGESIVLAAVLREICEKASSGTCLVPRNIICSKKCAMPERPGGSSTAPTLNQSIWVATGAR